MDNFGLKVKATNVVGSGDGVEVFVHCDDHDIVFNASIPFDKSIIDSNSSLRSEDKGDDMSTFSRYSVEWLLNIEHKRKV